MAKRSAKFEYNENQKVKRRKVFQNERTQNCSSGNVHSLQSVVTEKIVHKHQAIPGVSENNNFMNINVNSRQSGRSQLFNQSNADPASPDLIIFNNLLHDHNYCKESKANDGIYMGEVSKSSNSMHNKQISVDNSAQIDCLNSPASKLTTLKPEIGSLPKKSIFCSSNLFLNTNKLRTDNIEISKTKLIQSSSKFSNNTASINPTNSTPNIPVSAEQIQNAANYRRTKNSKKTHQIIPREIVEFPKSSPVSSLLSNSVTLSSLSCTKNINISNGNPLHLSLKHYNQTASAYKHCPILSEDNKRRTNNIEISREKLIPSPSRFPNYTALITPTNSTPNAPISSELNRNAENCKQAKSSEKTYPIIKIISRETMKFPESSPVSPLQSNPATLSNLSCTKKVQISNANPLHLSLNHSNRMVSVHEHCPILSTNNKRRINNIEISKEKLIQSPSRFSHYTASITPGNATSNTPISSEHYRNANNYTQVKNSMKIHSRVKVIPHETMTFSKDLPVSPLQSQSPTLSNLSRTKKIGISNGNLLQLSSIHSKQPGPTYKHCPAHSKNKTLLNTAPKLRIISDERIVYPGILPELLHQSNQMLPSNSSRVNDNKNISVKLLNSSQKNPAAAHEQCPAVSKSPDASNSSSNTAKSSAKTSSQINLHDHNYFQQNICNDMSKRPQTLNVTEHYLGSMNVECEHCKAKHFEAERVSNKGNSFNDCCSHGKVKLNPLPDPPEILKQLFNGTHEMSSHFYDRIRYYNNSFSFASFMATQLRFNNSRPGPYCFKIQGQIYYQINTALYPAHNEIPTYGQLFIVDTNEAVDYRLNSHSGANLNADILQAIDNTMRQYNIFAKSYQMMKEELEVMTQRNNGVEPELQLLFTLKKGLDIRRYNYQRQNEVAAVFSTTADGEIPDSYVTIRNRNTKVLQHINSLNENVEPWTYPLFYPHGTKGWSDNLKMVDSTKRVTRNAYFKYRMAIRDDESNYFHMGRRLFQQWVVDSYVKIEKDRLNFLRFNQKKIRADSYEGLLDHLQQRADNANSRVGKVIILPSSYQGSPRNMLQTYQDAMAIVRRFGKPDLFVTMTCNPKWKEITENLLDGQTAADRPDLVARVFELKKDELLKVITKKKIFGEIQAYVYVIEYQKRGLPHVHLLLTLKPNSKITIPEMVDKYISAEMPDPAENPKLHEIIKNNMVHGPCGDWCLDKNRCCSKRFPKQFNDETTMDEDGYPTYKRRNTGTYIRPNPFDPGNPFIFDNRHVVPHNRELLLMFNCHINVEVVSSIKAVKYLYKYIYKGHDAAAITIQETQSNETPQEAELNGDRTLEHDEINNYLETRYVCPPEACTRIFNFNLQGRSHSVTRLPIHLENQQTVIVDDMDNEDLIRSALNKQTMLIDYFALNERDPLAKNFTYAEIPTHYVFKKRQGAQTAQWEPRKTQFNVLGRMHSVSPTQTELFHLRLLLISVKGATSYENLRTVNGIVYNDYISTCLALGLIEDDNEWRNAMHEAEVWMMPRQLRQLFVRILIHCHPLHPEELWEEFKDGLSSDFSRTMNMHQAHRKAYIQINTLLNQERSSLAAFPSMAQITEIEDIENEILPAQHRVIGTEQYKKLNKEQKYIADTVLERLNTDNDDGSKCFFIDGPGGSGKTFIYTTLYHMLRSEERKVCTMAYTGIAATLLPRGQTVHRTFKLPIALYSDSSQTIKAQSPEAEYLRKTDMFIWDEAPMAPRHALELADRTLRDIMNNDEPFGGKIFILGGDFRQLLPVKKHATRGELVNLSIKFSSLWPSFTQFSLTENMRTLPEEAEFAKYLLSIGDGSANVNDSDLHLPQTCLAPSDADIAEDLYGEVIRNKDFEKLTKWAILSARNVDVDNINKKVVELLDPTTERIYTSVNTIKNCDNGEMAENILPEYLETLNPPNLPPHELRLRINTVVMLIRNLSINEGLCNGTRLQILELSDHLLKCKILTGDKTGQIVFINRITLYSDETYGFEFGRRQFPIRLAFAMTINKAQGQTFERIGIDLRRDVFSHGQFYVSLSRVRSWDSLKIYLGDQRDTNVVKNYVFTELLKG